VWSEYNTKICEFGNLYILVWSCDPRVSLVEFWTHPLSFCVLLELSTLQIYENECWVNIIPIGKLYFHNTKYFMNVPREAQTQWCFSLSLVWFWCLKPLSTIFHLYRGGQFYWGRKPDHPENHRPVASNLQMLSHNVVSSTPGLSRVWNHNTSGDTYWLHR
jgi:hypothetical protein